MENFTQIENRNSKKNLNLSMQIFWYFVFQSICNLWLTQKFLLILRTGRNHGHGMGDPAHNLPFTCRLRPSRICPARCDTWSGDWTSPGPASPRLKQPASLYLRQWTNLPSFALLHFNNRWNNAHLMNSSIKGKCFESVIRILAPFLNALP